MRCPASDEWVLLSLDLARVFEVESGARRDHLAGCAACREAFAQASRDHAMLERLYRTMDSGHGALREQLMAALPAAPADTDSAGHAATRSAAAGRPGIRRTAWAAAAAAVLAVAALLFSSQDGGVAFARVVEHFQGVETISCHVSRVVTGGEQPNRVEGRLYISLEHGSVGTFFVEGLNVLTVWAPAGRPIVHAMHPQKSYMVVQVSDDDPEAPWRNPGGKLLDLRSLTEDAGVRIGSRITGGQRVTGFWIPGERLGIEDPTAGVEIWVEEDTGMPVQVTLVAAGTEPGQRMILIYDRFEWNSPLEAELFEPAPPEGYRRLDVELPRPDEQTLVEGLRVFARLSGGSYPQSLAGIQTEKELEAIFLERFESEGSPFDPDSTLYDEIVRQSLVVKTACRFYAGLVKAGQEPEYFGAEVRAGDAGRVLLAWRLDDGGKRVIYGDLEAETLPAQSSRQGGH